MAEKLYWKDPYMREFEAVVTKVDGTSIYLDRTAFYPAGGGQPADTGKIIINGKEYPILDVKKEGSEIKHICNLQISAKVGDKVNGIIDWERRYAIMRYHTALHLLNAIVEKSYATAVSKGNQIYQDRARIDLDVPELNREKIGELVNKANLVIMEGHEISAREISRKEALAIHSLAKTEPGKALINSLDRIRVVEIIGVDIQMDGGTHVNNTKEMGTIRLKSFESKGAHNKRIEFTLV